MYTEKYALVFTIKFPKQRRKEGKEDSEEERSGKEKEEV